MRLFPATSSIDDIYARSRLKKPRRAPDFDELRSRVRNFSRDSLVGMGARVLWYLWHHPRVFKADVEAGRDSTQIAWAHAAGVIGLACIYAPIKGRPEASEADFRVLAHELFTCPDGSHLVTDHEANSRLLGSLESISARPGRERLKRIPRDDIALVHVAAMLAMLARPQMRGHMVRSISRLVRASTIYDLLSVEAETRGLGAALTRAEHAVLRTDHSNYMRALLVLRQCAHDSASHPERADVCPGVMLLGRNCSIGDDWGATKWDDVLVIAERLAEPILEARRSIGAIPRMKPWERASSHEVWFLRRRPMILLPPSQPDVLQVLAPDPWLLEDIAERELLHEIPASAHTESAPFLSLRGEAFQAYLRGGFGALPNIVDVDALPGVNKRRPDFVWMGDRFGIVIEAKMTLSPYEDPEHRLNTSVLKAWALGCEAIEQGCEFVRSGHPSLRGDGRRMWVMLIVTMEPNAADVTCFAAAAKRWSMLEDTQFSALHVADVAELEHFALTGSADQYGEMLLQRWSSLSTDFLRGQDPVRYEENKVVPSVSATWDRLFSPTSNPWTSGAGG